MGHFTHVTDVRHHSGTSVVTKSVNTFVIFNVLLSFFYFPFRLFVSQLFAYVGCIFNQIFLNKFRSHSDT